MERASPGEESPYVGKSNTFDFHVFSSRNKYFAFDARNFNIVELDEIAALGLQLIQTFTGDQSRIDRLAPSHQLIALLDSGFFSEGPIDRPADPPLSGLVLMLASGCNMGCSYCFERDVSIYQNSISLTAEMADKIFDWFFANHSGSSIHVEFYGGEPLLAWDVLQYSVEKIDNWARQRGLPVSKYLITNGTLLDAPKAKYLAEKGVVVQVSIDGDKQTHDRFRVMKGGAGTHDRAVKAAENLRQNGADFNVRAVVTKKSLRVDDILGSLQTLGSEKVSFGVVSTRSRELRLDDDDWDTLVEKYRAYIHTKVAEGQIPAVIRSIIRTIIRRRRIIYGCGAGLSELTVAPDGNIYECQRLMGNPIGTIVDKKSLAELGSKFLQGVDDRPTCCDCFARYLCGGGCKASFVTETGFDQPFYGYCLLKRAQVEEAVAVIADLQDRPELSTSVGSGAGRTATRIDGENHEQR